MLAIHCETGGFSDRWIAYCEEQGIPYKTVDCYHSSIIEHLSDCDALLWHHNHAYPVDQLMAKPLLFSLEQAGKVVFPDFKTTWHYDDKLGQKYLFEALNLPAVQSYVFYSKREARDWAKHAVFPMVFKLRRGAGSRNVWLVKKKQEANKLINKAFGRGFRQYDAWGAIYEQYRKLKLGKSTRNDLLKAIAHLWVPLYLEKAIGREKGYVYFQEFIPYNTYDIRVIVIKDKAFAIKRNVRKNDFRASGSGSVDYEKEHFSNDVVRLSFEMAEKLQSTCVGFDIVFKNKQPYIVEITYGFNKCVYDGCTGYWDRDLNWYPGKINPYGWMIEAVLQKVDEKKKS